MNGTSQIDVTQIGAGVVSDEPVVWFCTRELGTSREFPPCFATNAEYVRAHPGYNWSAMHPMTFMGRPVLVHAGIREAVAHALINSALGAIKESP